MAIMALCSVPPRLLFPFPTDSNGERPFPASPTVPIPMTPSPPTTTRKTALPHMWLTHGWPPSTTRLAHLPREPKHSPHPPSPPTSPPPKKLSRTPPALGPPQYVAPEAPQQGAWRRRNPNWTQKSPQRARFPSPAGSLVPTVLVDEDGRTIKDTELTDNEFDALDDVDDGIGLGRLTELSRPVVSIFDTKREDISHIRETAARLGVHSAVVHRGAAVGIARERSWWVVLGQNAGLVGEVVDAQQGGMPGVIASDAEMAAPLRMVTFVQLVIAGLIGGIVVVFGLSIL
ncbi:hypothetical protein BD779DRAFT_1796487 [Infundibulicybe gibba]|nr:hypothetical protein BD779DRAFT_1796487 [Infundibulicybe gibba]